MGAIYWDEMWNVTCGCTRESVGCNNCWAIRMAARHQANPKVRGVYKSGVVADGDWTGKIVLLPHNLEKPLGWHKPRVIFVNGMSDLFHPEVPKGYIREVFTVMSETPQHTYLLLTKRADRQAEIVNSMRSYFPDRLDHVWPGVTIEDQDQADIRIGQLLRTRAAHCWVSVEPMLGHINFRSTLPCTLRKKDGHLFCVQCERVIGNKRSIHSKEEWDAACLAHVRQHGWLDLVACGPENGPGKRPFDPQWAIDLMIQCQQAGVPFFYKGGLLDGKKYLELPWELR
jgi:protein gp37